MFEVTGTDVGGFILRYGTEHLDVSFYDNWNTWPDIGKPYEKHHVLFVNVLKPARVSVGFRLHKFLLMLEVGLI